MPGPGDFSGGYAPLVSGTPYSPMYGYEGMPFSSMGGPAMAALSQFALQPMMMQMHQRTGFTPLGFHDRNAYDVLRHMQYTRMHDEAVRQASEMDRRQFMEGFRGLAALTGTPWGAEQRQAARSLSNMATYMSPMLVRMAPNLLDELAGPRGSQAVMAHYASLGGRYRLDPVTGQMGMSANTVGAMVGNLYQGMYEDGGLTGISAGQAGQMFDELSRRGMIATPGGTLRGRTMAALGELGRFTPSELQNMSGADIDKLRFDPDVETRLRAVDADAVRRSLQSYSQAVAAIRDIFGDMGRTGAPMQELIAGLEAMTGGNLSQIAPGRLNSLVRNTYNLATQTGIGLPAAMAMQQHAALTAQRLGIEPVMALQATQGAMAFGGAYTSAGLAAHTAWGKSSAEALMQMDLNLRMQGAASEAGNRLGAVMRIGADIGGFTRGSAAAALADTLRAGRDSFIDPRTGQKVFVEQLRGAGLAELLSTGTDSPVTSGVLQQYLSDKRSNAEYVEQFGLGNVLRLGQGRETAAFISNSMQASLRSHLKNAGVANAEAIAASAGGRMATLLSTMTPAERASPQRRNAKFVEALQSELIAAGVTLSNDQLAMITGSTWGTADTEVRRRFGRSLQDTMELFNPETMARQQQQMDQAQMKTMMQSAFAGLGRGSILQDAIGYLESAKPGEATIDKMLAAIGGGIDPKSMNEAVSSGLIAIAGKRKDLQLLQQQWLDAKDPKERARLMDEMRAKHDEIVGASASLAELAGKQGIFIGDTLGRKDITATKQSMAQLMGDLGSVRAAAKAGGREWWKSAGGEEFRRLSRNAMADVTDLMHRAAESKHLMSRMTKSGVAAVSAGVRATQDIRLLASRYTGGDIARLKAGDFAAEDHAKVMEEVTAALTKQQGAVAAIDEASGRIKEGDQAAIPDEIKSDVEKLLDAVAGDPRELMKNLYSAFGVEGEGATPDMIQLLESSPAAKAMAARAAEAMSSRDNAFLSRFGLDKKGMRGTDLNALLMQAATSGDSGGTAGKSEMKISGQLTLVGFDKADVDAAGVGDQPVHK